MEVVKNIEPFAISRQDVEHLEAMEMFGERIILRRVWTLEDFLRGRTTRCTYCHAGDDTNHQARVAAVYKGAGDSWCSHCFGTGFTGGFEPVVYITYMLAVTTPADQRRDRTGEMIVEQPRVQLPGFPDLNENDLIVRFKSWIDKDTPGTESGRFLTQEIDPVRLRTGLALPDADTTQIAQETQLAKLPQEHVLYSVEIS